MGEGNQRWEKFRRKVERANERAEVWFRKHVGRGIGYRIWQYFGWGLIAALVISLAVIGLIVLILAKVSLETNTILSIMVADIPIGLFLWLALERRESKRRRLLDAAEIVVAPTRYTNLVIHYCDEFADGTPPDLRYYVVNTKSKVAYFVDAEVQALVKARFIRKFPRHRDLAELNRYFDTNGITHASSYPQGDDLFRDTPFQGGDAESEEEI